MWWKRGLVVAAFLLMPVTGIWLAGTVGDSPAGAETDYAPSSDPSGSVQK